MNAIAALESEPSKFDTFDTLVREKTSQAESQATALITMQITPDPDSLASALALQWILESRYSMSVDIIALNDVSHPQNQTMKNVLDIRLGHKPKLDQYDLIAVVDTVPQNTGFEDLNVDMVFDHHHFDQDFPFSDVQNCGSCSSILWSYAEAFGMDWSSERGQQVATALLFGVRNDTSNLCSENTSSIDIDASGKLSHFVDRKKMSEILNYSFPSYLYDLRCIAVDNKLIKDSTLITSLGMLTPKKRDALPIIADELMRMEGIETVVVHAFVGDCVEASVRSNNSSISVHDFCQKIFGESFAGGKTGAGGARRPLGFPYSPSDSEELRSKYCEAATDIIKTRILAYLSGG